MSRPRAASPYPVPVDAVPVFNAIADAAAVAEAYSRTAGEFAALGDAKGLGYALRCASAAILSAASLTDELRPARLDRERAA